jgi:copper chaperone CopZ
VKALLKVKGMHCNSCQVLLREVVSEIKGVESAKADFKKGVVEFDAESQACVEEAKKAIEKEGYGVL